MWLGFLPRDPGIFVGLTPTGKKKKCQGKSPTSGGVSVGAPSISSSMAAVCQAQRAPTDMTIANKMSGNKVVREI